MCDCDDDCCCGCSLPAVLAMAVAAIGVLLLVILLPLSLHRIPFDQVGLKYDKVSKKLGTEVLREGLHDLSPSGSLISFTITQRTVPFNDFPALTRSGLEVLLDLTVAYVLKQWEVPLIVAEWGSQAQWDRYIYAQLESHIRALCITFNADQFYTQRAFFQSSLQEYLSNRFNDSAIHATLSFVQVINVDLPHAVANAINLTTVAAQDIANAQSERNQKTQAATIARNLAVGQAQLTVLGAEVQASQIEQQTQQTLLQTRTTIQLRTYAFGNISAGMGRGGNFFVQTYLQPMVLQNAPGRSILGLN